MSKKMIFVIIIVVTALMAFFVISGGKGVKTENKIVSTVNLSHREIMKISPDVVTIYMGVESISEKVNEASLENNKKINKVKKLLESDKSIEIHTSSFQVRPIYEKNETNETKVSYYKVVNILKVALTELNKTGEIIDTALRNGVNYISRFEYSLKDKESAKAKVLKKGLAGLEKKAELVTEELKYDQYNLKNLQVNDSYQLREVSYRNLQDKIYEEKGRTTPISPDKIEIAVTVRGEYLIK